MVILGMVSVYNMIICRTFFQSNLPDELFEAAVDAALENHLVDKDDVVVITAGVPVGVSHSTNMMKVERVDKTL